MAKKGEFLTDETKRKIGETNKMAFHPYPSEVTRLKMSESHKGKKKTKEHCLNLSKSLKGKPKSEEHKKNMSKALKGKTFEERFGKENANIIKKKLSESAKCRITTEETKKKIGDANRGKLVGYKRSRESILKQIESRKGYRHTPETRKKIREGQIKHYQENNTIFKDTKPEQEAESILKKYNLNYKKQKALKYNNSYRLYDFYLLDYNILLEIDGCYWHSKNIKDEDIKNRTLKDMRQNDQIKDKLAQDNGYTLIRIWEDEIFKLEEYCSKGLFLVNKVG